jgi:hypothetical protein
MRLCNGVVDGNGNGIGIGNGIVGNDVGTGNIDGFEGLYLTPFLPSRIVVPTRRQAV